MRTWAVMGALLTVAPLAQAQHRQGRFEETQAPVAAAAVDDVLVKFSSVPARASVWVDNVRLCDATPCRKRLRPGTHDVSFILPFFTPWSRRVEVAETLQLHAELTSSAATLVVLSSVHGVRVSVNGNQVGKAPLPSLRVEAGDVEVAVDDPCYVRNGERLSLKPGERRIVVLEPRTLLAPLKVDAEDRAGNAMEGRVLVDGKVAGEIGKTLFVPACSKRVTIAGVRGWSEALSLTSGALTEVRYEARRENEQRGMNNNGLLQAMGGRAGISSKTFGPGGLGTGINNALGGLKGGAGMGDSGGVGGLVSRSPPPAEQGLSPVDSDSDDAEVGSTDGCPCGEDPGEAGLDEPSDHDPVSSTPGLGLGGLGTKGVGRDDRGQGTRIIPGWQPVVGGLAKDVIAKVIKRHENEIKYCYESELQKTPELSGKVGVYWIIDGSGSVADATISESTLGSPTVENCILVRVRRWKFPEPDGGGQVSVTFPWTFKPAVSGDE